MNILIFPSFIEGIINAKSSKSIAHRYIIICSFLKQTTTIKNIDLNNDLNETINVLKALGTSFKYDLENKTLTITPGELIKTNKFFEINESGTTFRMLLPLLCYLFKEITIKTSKRLKERIKNTEDSHFIYIYKEDTIEIHKNFDVNLFLDDKFTTQYISGFLILSAFFSELNVNLLNKIIDPYILLTIKALNDCKIISEFQNVNHNLRFVVKNKGQFNTLTVEGDYSNTAMLLVMGALSGNIKVTNLFKNSIQGDAKIVEILKSAGVNIIAGKNYVRVKTSTILPLDVDLQNIPDLGPLLLGLAAVTPGVHYFKNFTRLINKESNRLKETIRILSLLNVLVKVDDNLITVYGLSNIDNPGKIILPNDHRIIMMLIAISSKFKNNIEITNVEALNKSYPFLLDDLKKLGFKMEVTDV